VRAGDQGAAEDLLPAAFADAQANVGAFDTEGGFGVDLLCPSVQLSECEMARRDCLMDRMSKLVLVGSSAGNIDE
jgi:hypothetical protein